MYGAYTEDAHEYQEVVDRLRRKWETAKHYVPSPVIEYSEKYKVGIISIGSCDGAVKEARARLGESGVGLNYLRIKSFPFNGEVEEFLHAHDRVFVVEQNRDAQLRALLLLESQAAEGARLKSILSYDGLPISARCIIDGINEDLAKGVAA